MSNATGTTVTDEAEYFEASITDRALQVEIAAWCGSGRVLLDEQVLTPQQARQLARYLRKASKLAESDKLDRARDCRNR